MNKTFRSGGYYITGFSHDTWLSILAFSGLYPGLLNNWASHAIFVGYILFSLNIHFLVASKNAGLVVGLDAFVVVAAPLPILIEKSEARLEPLSSSRERNHAEP